MRSGSSKSPSHTDAPGSECRVSRMPVELRALGLLTPENGLLWGWPLFWEAATLIDLCSFSRQ